MSFRLGDYFPLKGSPRKTAQTLASRSTPGGKRRSEMVFEPIEARVLLSADMSPAVSAGLENGLNLLGNQVEQFLRADDVLGDRVPILLKAGKDAQDKPIFESPTVLDLLSVPVDADGNDTVDRQYDDTGLVLYVIDDDEAELQALDNAGDGNGVVDPGEFLQGWFFDMVEAYLANPPVDDTADDFADFLEGGLIVNLDRTLDQLSGEYKVEFEIDDAKVANTTDDPTAAYTFNVGFNLTVRQSMPIDLGLEADALRIMPFEGSAENPDTPEIEVVSTLAFAFEFGVFTGGQGTIDYNDFFVRKAEPLAVSVKAEDSGLNFNLNIGFLGAEVVNGSLKLQADVQSLLIDPNDPVVLGFIDAQHGEEQTSGTVTAANELAPIPLDHSTGFFLRIGNLGIATAVNVADADPGVADSSAQVIDDIEAALIAAGIDGLVGVSLVGGKVTFQLTGTSDTPLNFGNETNATIAPSSVLLASPDGDGGSDFEYSADQTLLLSVGGALPHLVRVNFRDPSQTDLGLANGQEATVPPLVAPDAAGPVVLSADAGFTVTVWLSDGSQSAHTFTLTAAETAGNVTAGNLASDIDLELTGSPIDLRVQASADGAGHIRFSATSPLVSAIRVEASGTATSEIGFAADAIVGLQLLASGVATADLSEAAIFKLTLDDNGTLDTYTIVVPDNNRGDLSALATDISGAIAAEVGAGRIGVVVSGNRILLYGADTAIRSFDVTTINETIDDLVLDVNRALATAGLAGQVVASAFGAQLELEAAGGQSLEISHTLTLDAGVTYAELYFATPDTLFSASEGTDSTVRIKLPVEVLPGLRDAVNNVANWDPQHVALVANFDPFDSPAADYDEEVKRFDLHFTYTPEPGVPAQDSPVGSVPLINDLSDEFRLVNFGELLNFSILGAESMIGLLGGLGTALQQLSDSSPFTSYGIPFADATLSDLLNFTDSDKKRYSGLIDMLMFDTGGDGIDGPKADTDGLMKKVTVDGTSYLLPSYSTAQTLAKRLNVLLGAPLTGDGGINATYHTGTNELTYRVDLHASDRTAVDTDVDFEHDVSLAPFSKLTVDSSAPPVETQVELRGRTGLGMTFGVDLSPPGFVVFPSTTLGQLNSGAGVDILRVKAITGTEDLPVGAQPTFANPTPPPVPQLSADTWFRVSFDNGATSTRVDISKASTLNNSMGDFAADIDNALAAAGIADKLKADFDGRRLVLAARSQGIDFKITAVDLGAYFEIGLAAGMVAGNADLVVIDRQGTRHEVVLDGLNNGSTLQQVIDTLNDVGLTEFKADFNGTDTGLRLVDTSGGSGKFSVESVNGSGALLGLGLFLTGDDDLPNTFNDGDPKLIEGGGIGLTRLDKRFFVRDAQLRIDGLDVKTPDAGVPGEGLYGIVGVDAVVSGGLIANVTAQLTDPANPDSAKNQITLYELLDKKTGGTLANPSVDKVTKLKYKEQQNVSPFTEFKVGGLLLGSTLGDTAVIVGINDDTTSGDLTGTLLLAHVTGSFSDNETIFQQVSVSEVASAKADGASTGALAFGAFDLDVTVQPGFDDAAFDAQFLALDGMSYELKFDITAFGSPFTNTPPDTSDLNLALLGELQSLDKLSYTGLATVLEDLLAVMEGVQTGFAPLTVPLPAINRSVSDLLSLITGFERGVANAGLRLDAAIEAIGPKGRDLPALRLQDMGRALRGAFGLPDAVDPYAGGTLDWVKLDYDTGADELLLSLQLHEDVSTKLGLDIVAGVGLPNLTSAGVLQVSGKLDTRLDVAIDLTDPTKAYLLDSSRIDGELHVRGEGQEYITGEAGLGLVFRSSVGPLAVFVQDGDVKIDYAFALPGLDFGGSSRKALGSVQFADFKPAVVSQDAIDIVLPMFFGGEGPDDFIGEYKAIGSLGAHTVTPPDFSVIATGITSGSLPFDPFDNILLAVDTLDLYLESLSDQLAGDVLGIQLPFIGDQMADVLFIEDFRSTLVRALKNGVENAVNPTAATVTGILNGLFGTGGALDSYVSGDVAVSSLLTGPVDARYRQWSFTVAHTDTVKLDDFDIGPDHLGFDIKAPVTVTFDWSVEIAFGVDFGNGAYIDVSDTDEVDLDLTIRMPSNMAGNAYTGELGYLRLDAKDPGADSGAKVSFDIDVGGDASFGRLGFADLGSLNPLAMVSGDALNATDKAATFKLVTRNAAGMPDLRTDFIFDWQLASTNVATLGGDAVTPGITLIALDNMELDAISGIKRLLGPAFDTIITYIEPFMPVVDVLTAPIPILSDLAGEPFTLLDLAAIFGDVDPRFIDAVADILDVIQAVDSLSDATAWLMPLGDLTLYDPGNGITNFDPALATSRLSAISVDLLTTPGLDHDDAAFEAKVVGNDFVSAVRDGELAEGLDMPILTNAAMGIRMLLDQPADLITYELPPLGVAFDYLQVFPVWGPLAVSIEISFGFTVDLHGVGFDTFGYKRYADGGFRNEALMFDGFFLSDGDLVTKEDLPDVTFEFGLVGAAEINLGIARAGVGGGIDATIVFDWHDSIPDGNVHISELVGNVVATGNPLAVFDVSGALTFQMFAFLEISLLGIDEKFPITPETELFSFNVDIARDPVLATKVGDTLYLNMGPSAQDRLNGNTSDGNEEMALVYDSGSDTVKVSSTKLGASNQPFTGINHIVGIGGEGNDTITLTGFDGSGITGDFDGGVGDDVIKYISAGGSASVLGARIVGGLGNDTLWGGDGNDTIIGGEGNDQIKGQGGYDVLFGDFGRDATTLDPRFISVRITDADGADDIDGGDADDVVIGAGGSDTLNGGAGNDLILGDGGRFEYSMLDDHVNLAALRPADYVLEPPGTYKNPEQISKEIDAIQDAVFNKIRATELGLGGNDVIRGDGGNDLVLGGSGDDDIEGNGGDDLLLGGKGFDYIRGGADNDTIFGGDQADVLDGDGGNDVMSGDAGNDLMHGNAGDDVMKGGTGGDVMFGDAGDDQVFGQTEPDVLFGGLDDDLVVGGSSNDIMFGDDGLVAKLNKADGSGLKVIGIGFGGAVPVGQSYDADNRTVDLILTDVVAGDGNDMMSGDAGDDLMLGGGGNDLMAGDVDPRLPNAGPDTSISEDVLIGDGGRIVFDQRRFKSIETVIGADATGSPFNDVIFGDNGNDYILGGRGSDFLFGGHGKLVDVGTEVVGAARGATEGDDNDIIVGDNGEMLFAGSTIATNFGRLELVRTTDIIDTTGGHEYAEGQLGNDVIFGGVNGSVDVLFGNEGDDVVLGDNGEIDFDFDDAAHDLGTLDLIRSYRDGLGGVDTVSGSAGDDVLIGGTAGDTMYGDDAEASSGATDGEDVMLGDNARIRLIGTSGRLTVMVASMTQGSAIDLITTIDDVDPGDANFDTLVEVNAVGGPDTMSGNGGADIVIGGINGGSDPLLHVDRLYGDRFQPTVATIALDRDDILIGDNALLDFTFAPDTDRSTLDLIRSFEDGLGGTDVLSGNRGSDVGIGGTGNDTLYGDAATLAQLSGGMDLGDLLAGDNADLFLVAAGLAQGGDLKVVLGAAVKTLRSTDEEHPEYGGSDTISGNAGGDIALGGVQGDTIYGDRADVSATNALDGNDVLLGDNGALEWLSTGRLAEVTGIVIADENPGLWAKFGTNLADGDLTTLDLITTEQPNSGGRDLIFGDNGRDTILGGTDADRLHGDSDDLDAATSSNGNDLMFGDHGRLYPQFSTQTSVNSRNFFAIDIGNAAGGEGDEMWGEEGDDIMLGQQGDDRMWGGSGNDDMTGGHNVMGGYDELGAPVIVADLNVVADIPYNVSMNDAMDGGSGDDAMAGDNAIIWRRGDDLSPRFRLVDDANAATTNDAMYTTTPDTITTNVGSVHQSDPNDAVGRDIRLLDHSDAVQLNPLGRFGNDVMAGGSQNDVMFGQLGDDLMQGDGSIAILPVAQPALPAKQWVVRAIDFDDSGSNPDTDQKPLYFNVPEAATDGDDYMEGNGGRDLMYGGLGQDDMIGGSSALFGLDDADPVIANALRPDSSDTMFGGAGVDIDRNDLGDATTVAKVEDGRSSVNVVQALVDGHARDADFMMGDNANVFRLAATTNDAFRTFNFDTSGSNPESPVDADDYDGLLRLVPRAMQQLDYTLGGGDYAGGGYNGDGQAMPTGKPVDNGAADLIHGESGDDIIFGMTGSDVLFGEGQNDDTIGGYGHDWISGGTGQDGVLGDDGLIYTSRNSTTGEALYGVAGLNAASTDDTKYSNGNVLDEAIATPGGIQTAIINRTGELKKTVDLVPFSYDKGWIARDDEFPDNDNKTPFADDIVFGGWGSDWLHGGSGDDAISGAEALWHAYVPVYDPAGAAVDIYDLGYAAVGVANALVVNPTHGNPGNVLAFNPLDVDGLHLNNRFRAGEFRLYDEFDPRRKIMLDDSGTGIGELDKTGGGAEWLLNFTVQRGTNGQPLAGAIEGAGRPAGTVPKATGQQTESYEAASDDGADAIFGDLGNDWLVGGTGRDNIYGGWGNDYLLADDDLNTETAGVAAPFDNESPDTQPTFEDRAYGGAGRDILVGNTGGDRLMDWVGEYNSYLVPYAPFGQASVSRTLQPFLPEFLYALSAGDGADPTRYRDAVNTGTPPVPTTNNPIPTRFGEPSGELGLVLQKDFAWGDQTGAPADPQAGNIPGGPRDVLRSADFAGNNANGFVAASGTWTVANNAYEVAPLSTSTNRDAISLFNSDVTVPSYFEITATINAIKPVGGFKANAYIIFDYYSPTDFKFAGINVSTNKIEIGQRASWGFQVLASQNMLLKAGLDYNVLVAINGSAVQMVVNNAQSVSYAFTPRRDSDGFTYGIAAGMYGLGADNAKARIDNAVVQRIPPKVTLTAVDTFNGAASTLLTPYSSGWSVQTGRFVGTPAAGAPFAVATNDIAVGVSAMLKLDVVLSTTGTGGVVFDLYSPTDFKWAAISKTTNQVMVGHYTAKAGWVVDMAVSRTLAAGDNTLSVTLKDTTASVSLNGQLVLSRLYNGTVVDGAVGTFARGGTSSFDSFSFQTDDAKFAAATSSSSAAAATAAAPQIDWRSTSVAAAAGGTKDPSIAAVDADDWRSAFVTKLGARQALSAANRSLSLSLL